MDDRILEREIESLLAVEPSHDFTVRVRRQIATAPARDRRAVGLRAARAGFAWALGTAAVVAALATLIVRVDRQPATDRQLSGRAMEIEAYHPPIAVRGSRPRIETPVVRLGSTGERRGSVRAEPEVVIDPREAAAWRRLLSGAGTVTLSFATDTARAIEMLAPTTDEVAIPPIVIEPLAPLREQGVPK